MWYWSWFISVVWQQYVIIVVLITQYAKIIIQKMRNMHNSSQWTYCFSYFTQYTLWPVANDTLIIHFSHMVSIMLPFYKSVQQWLSLQQTLGKQHKGIASQADFFLIISFMDQFTLEKFNRPAAMCMTEKRTVTLQFSRMYFSRAYWCGFSSDNKLLLPCCRMSPVMWCFVLFFLLKDWSCNISAIYGMPCWK